MSSKGETAASAAIYDDRVRKLMDRMTALRPTPEEDPAVRGRDFERSVKELEKKIAKQRESRAQWAADFTAVLKKLQSGAEAELDARKKLGVDLEGELAVLQKLVRRATEEASSARHACDSRLVFKLNTAVETLSDDLERLGALKELECSEELEALVSHDIPRMRDELFSEVALRKELEAKIVAQFSLQTDELAGLLTEDRKKREKKEEEILAAVNATSKGVEAALTRLKADRERSENEILALIEKVIERLRSET